MFPYWLLFLIFAAGAIFYQLPGRKPAVAGVQSVRTPRAEPLRMSRPSKMRNQALFATAVILLILMVGLRYQVGGDWVPYLVNFAEMKELSLREAFLSSSWEPGYVLINWIGGRLGGGVWIVNLFCAAIFAYGLVTLAKQQPNPWLALVVAIPFFVIGVGMGYTRQSVAAGFLLVGLSKLAQGTSFWKFVGWVVLGALFHRSVLFAIPIAAMFVSRNRLVVLALGALSAAVAYYNVATALEQYSTNYIEAQYEARGATIRLAMNAIPASLILVFSSRFHFSPIEKSIWRGWAILTFIALAALFLVPSSVAVDRMSIYLIPIQIYALSRLPVAFGEGGSASLGLTFLIVFYSAAVQFVWLNFANHAEMWIPYRLYVPF